MTKTEFFSPRATLASTLLRRRLTLVRVVHWINVRRIASQDAMTIGSGEACYSGVFAEPYQPYRSGNTRTSAVLSLRMARL
jgi:hypothetical protein